MPFSLCRVKKRICEKMSSWNLGSFVSSSNFIHDFYLFTEQFNLKFLFKCWGISLTFMKKLCCTQNSWLCFKHLMECKKYGLVLFLDKKYIFFDVKRFNIIHIPSEFLIKSSEILVLTCVNLVIFTFVLVKRMEWKISKKMTKIEKDSSYLMY